MEKGFKNLFAVNNVLTETNLKKIIEHNYSEKEKRPFLGNTIIKLFEDIRDEPKPLRKYYIENSLAKQLHELLKEISSPDFGWFKAEFFKMICDKYYGEVGLVYTKHENNCHFVYSIHEDNIQIASFSGTLNRFDYSNYDGYITITPQDEGEDIFDKIRTCGYIGAVRELGYDDPSIKLVYDTFKKDSNQGNFSIEEISEYIIKVAKANSFHKKNRRIALYKDEVERFGESALGVALLEGIKMFFTIYSLIILIYLKLSDVRVETFDAYHFKCKSKNFITPETGERNEGVIIVNKLYNTEIRIDAPFNVSGHWRNQYYGKDENGNPIHKRIWIEAYEKKGYHRQATKDIIDKELLSH